MRIPTFLGMAFVLAQAAGCGSFVSGSGRTIEETRAVGGGFTSVEVDDAIDATVSVGQAFSVTVRADDNVLPLVATELRGGVLVAHLPPATNVSSHIELTVTMPVVSEVDASGASHVVIAGITGASLSVNASGSSHVTAWGAADDLRATASGASTIATGGLVARRAHLDVSGPSDVDVRVSDAVAGQASGGARIHVHGGATTNDLALSGGSTVDFAP